jgi:ABC-2 type transport system ATP-binding protein
VLAAEDTALAAGNAVAVENLDKRYGRFTAVRDVSFGVPAGQVTALLGPNGAGKTTIIEILAGLQVPSAGRVEVLGRAPRPGGRAPGREWRARIGVVLQSASVDPQLTVAEALRLFARLYPRPRAVAEVLGLTGLTGDAGTRIGALSGGQRRRADLGLGLIGRPELLFLDEPTTGLDPEGRRQLWDAIRNLTAGHCTVLLTTHHLPEAEELASRLIVLDRGRVVADATPAQLRTAQFRAGGPGPRIRLPLPDGTPVAGLPPRLASAVDPGRGELLISSTDVAADLPLLLSWARQHRIDVSALEVGPPSLEDAYLALTGSGEPDRAPGLAWAERQDSPGAVVREKDPAGTGGANHG